MTITGRQTYAGSVFGRPRKHVDTFIHVDVTEVVALLASLQARISPPALLTFLKSQVTPWLQARVGRRFATQGTDTGGPWAELLPITQGIRWALGYNPTWPINVREGDFREWLTSDEGEASLSAGAGAELIFPGNAPSYTDEDKLVTAMGYGDAKARPVVEITEQDLDVTLAMLEAWIITPDLVPF